MTNMGERLAESRLVEDTVPPGHQSVWGSWYDVGTNSWGFACCKTTSPKAPPCCRIESDAEAGGSRPSRGSDVEVHMESYTAWRSRQDFETSEGFIVHATKHLASQWLQWLRDGSLTKQAHLLEPDARKVLLSEQAARGASSARHEEFCSCIGAREYAKASKAYMDIVMGARKWQGDVPYLVEGNRNGPSVVQNVAERLNKQNSNPLDEAGIRDHAVLLRRLLKVCQAVLPNEDPSKNCG
ncbi:unnamed protein product [Effrenium voratum]|uniref:Uncharacterized protein n=1 Tax=Effrenium voratum TaxID=2562239 RepID=A0AA36IGQ9_9DINO|nr:unnamed protein product [Effrenium voratum]